MTASPTLIDRPIITQIAELLAATFGNCRDAVAYVTGRGSATEMHYSAAGELRAGLLPEFLLRELDVQVPGDIQLPLATFTAEAMPELRDLPTVWTEIAAAPMFDGREWRRPPELLEELRARIEAFAVGPSFVVDHGDEWLIVWLLDTPARGDDAVTRARVERLQRTLARSIGGRVDEEQVAIARRQPRELGEATPSVTIAAHDPRRPVFRLPGSFNHFQGLGTEVRLVTAANDLEQSRVTLEQLEAAAHHKDAA
jgi:hypothetical protein